MANIVIDFSTKDFTTEFKALPEGEYLATIDSVELRATKAGDKDMLNVTYTIQQPAEYAGRKFWDTIVLAESTAWKIAAYLSGFRINFKEEGFLFGIDTTDDGKRTYTGLEFSKPDENNKVHFLGFNIGNGTSVPFYLVPLTGATVKLSLNVKAVEYKGKTSDQNSLRTVELVGNLPTAKAVETAGNTGKRSKFL